MLVVLWSKKPCYFRNKPVALLLLRAHWHTHQSIVSMLMLTAKSVCIDVMFRLFSAFSWNVPACKKAVLWDAEWLWFFCILSFNICDYLLPAVAAMPMHILSRIDHMCCCCWLVSFKIFSAKLLLSWHRTVMSDLRIIAILTSVSSTVISLQKSQTAQYAKFGKLALASNLLCSIDVLKQP